MELYTLKINVENQLLTFGENRPEIFSGDQSIDFVEFTFTDTKWDFPDIWAIFSRGKSTAYQVAIENNKAMIPAEIMQQRGYIYIGLMATDGTNVQTSSVLQYWIGQGAANVDAITPSASIYEQFLADLDAYQTAVADLEGIQSDIETAQGDITDLQGDIGDLQHQADNIEESLADSQQTFEGYIQQATEQAGLSEYYAGLSEQSASKSGYLYFEIDADPLSATYGHLLMERVNSPVNFILQNGHLYITEV